MPTTKKKIQSKSTKGISKKTSNSNQMTISTSPSGLSSGTELIRQINQQKKLDDMTPKTRKTYLKKKKEKRKQHKVNREQVIKEKIEADLKKMEERKKDLARIHDLKKQSTLKPARKKELDDLRKKYSMTVTPTPTPPSITPSGLSRHHSLASPIPSPVKKQGSSWNKVEKVTLPMLKNSDFAQRLSDKMKQLGLTNVAIKSAKNKQPGYYVEFNMNGVVNNVAHFHIFKEQEDGGGWRLILKLPFIVKTTSGNIREIDLRLLQNNDIIKERSESYNNNRIIIREKTQHGQTLLGESLVNKSVPSLKQDIKTALTSKISDIDTSDLDITLNKIFENNRNNIGDVWIPISEWYYNDWGKSTRGVLYGGRIKKNKKTTRKNKRKSKKCGRNLFKMIKKTIRLR